MANVYKIGSNLLRLGGGVGGTGFSGGSGDIVTVAGSGFGTVPHQDPHFFQSFTDTVQGDDYLEAGFDFIGGNSTSNANNYVDMAATLNGGGCWRTNSIAAETFSHFGKLMPASNDRVYFSFWRRVNITSPGDPGGQIKGTRCGSANGADTSDGDSLYDALPKYSTSDELDVSDPANTDEYCKIHWWTTSSGEQTVNDPAGEGQGVIDGTWHFIEGYYQINTLGNANGIVQRSTNNVLYHSVSNLQIKTASDEWLDYCNIQPGWANGFSAATFIVHHARIYVDNCRARVWLGNASTAATCTRKFLLKRFSWSDTEVKGRVLGTIPTGYNWAYVTTTSGSTNSSGLSYSVS